MDDPYNKILTITDRIKNGLFSSWAKVDKPHFDLFFSTISTSKKMIFQSTSWKRHCTTYWRKQRGKDSYRQWQISQSDCEIGCNCGTNCKWTWFLDKPATRHFFSSRGTPKKADQSLVFYDPFCRGRLKRLSPHPLPSLLSVYLCQCISLKLTLLSLTIK